MSDENGDYEENMTEERKEALKKLRTRIAVENPKELTVTAEVNPDMLQKSAWFDAQAKRLSAELRNQGVEIDSSEINPQNFTEKVDELHGLKKLRQKIERDADPTSRPSSGSLSLEAQKQGDNESDEWDSVQEMVRDIFTMSKAGSKRQQAKAKAIIEKMHRKTWTGHEERNIPFKSIEFKGEKDPETGKEKGIVEMLNEEYRKRERLKREKKNAED